MCQSTPCEMSRAENADNRISAENADNRIKLLVSINLLVSKLVGLNSCWSQNLLVSQVVGLELDAHIIWSAVLPKGFVCGRGAAVCAPLGVRHHRERVKVRTREREGERERERERERFFRLAAPW